MDAFTWTIHHRIITLTVAACWHIVTSFTRESQESPAVHRAKIGTGVGSGVGSGVGCAVGFGVGSGVGCGVGLGVGSNVG